MGGWCRGVQMALTDGYYGLRVCVCVVHVCVCVSVVLEEISSLYSQRRCSLRPAVAMRRNTVAQLATQRPALTSLALA